MCHPQGVGDTRRTYSHLIPFCCGSFWEWEAFASVILQCMCSHLLPKKGEVPDFGFLFHRPYSTVNFVGLPRSTNQIRVVFFAGVLTPKQNRTCRRTEQQRTHWIFTLLMETRGLWRTYICIALFDLSWLWQPAGWKCQGTNNFVYTGQKDSAILFLLRWNSMHQTW